jgi:heparanase 1
MPGAPTAAMKFLPSKEMLAAMGPDAVDVFSYHFYGGVSERCSTSMGGGGTSPAAALSEDWLARTDQVEAFYAKLRDEYEPGKPMWVTETGQTACGGDRWASTFLDSFRYVDQMGRLSRDGVKVIMHNTLAASDYGLIDEKTLAPRPDYWAALLWHRTMGTTVLDPGAAPAATVALYAHCMVGHSGGVSVLAINLSRTDAAVLSIPSKATRFTLSSKDLMSHTVDLNEQPLEISGDGDVPKLVGMMTAKGMLSLPAASITFLTFAEANNPACR